MSVLILVVLNIDVVELVVLVFVGDSVVDKPVDVFVVKIDNIESSVDSVFNSFASKMPILGKIDFTTFEALLSSTESLA